MNSNANLANNTPIINKNGLPNYKKYVSSTSLNCEDYLCKLYIENKDNNILLLENKGSSSKKISDQEFCIPKYNEYFYLNKNNYTIPQLKSIAKEYKLKIGGNKQQLTTRIVTFLFFSNKATKLQSVARLYLQKKYNSFHGPAFKNRSICVNTFDFLSMEDLVDIPYYQFFSYKDNDDGLIYGFDLLSLYKLLYKSSGPIKNPFNTKPLTSDILTNFRSLIRISRLFKMPIVTEIKDDPPIVNTLNQEHAIETRTTQLFHNIDLLGNYSQSSWFMSLNRSQLNKMMRELIDIWQYRAPLSLETKRAICPPSGSPFTNFSMTYIQTLDNFNDVRSQVLNVLEKFINTGIDRDSKALGAFYVLGALTLVNNDAAQALPWLFQAVCYI